MKTLMIVLVCAITQLLYGQTDEINLDKYWKFRNDYVEKFVKIGPNQGESLPAGKRKPCFCVDTHDFGVDGTGFGVTQYDEMHWGDGVLRQGHYLGFLATEYALLKRNDLDTMAILYEIFYALNALKRLDQFSEIQLGPIYEMNLLGNLNGHYLREDIPEDFCKEFETNGWDMECTNSSFYKNNNSGKLNDPSSNFIVKTDDYQNVPSLDQMSSILVGLRMAHKLVDNVFIQPTPSDDGFYIKDEIVAITDRIIRYAADHNWELIDINGWPVTNGGGDLVLTAYPITRCAEKMYGGTFNPLMSRNITSFGNKGDLQHCITGFGGPSSSYSSQLLACDNIGAISLPAFNYLLDGVPAGPNNNENNSVYQNWNQGGTPLALINSGQTEFLWRILIPNEYPVVYADWLDNKKFDQTFQTGDVPLLKFEKLQLSEYNNVIFFNLGVASGDWSQGEANTWGDITGNRQLELVNAVLKGETPIESKEFYQAYLDDLPETGPFYLHGVGTDGTGDPAGVVNVSEYAPDGWSSAYRWTHPEESTGNVNSVDQGIYAGLDYMYLHNLYYLSFENDLPDFKKEYECFCAPPIQVSPPVGADVLTIEAYASLNPRLAKIETCTPNIFEPVNNDIWGTFVIEPKFSNYSELGIHPSKFQTEDALLHQDSDIQILTDFVICNNKTLTAISNGAIVLDKGDLIVKSFATLDVEGVLRIKSDNKVDMDPDGRVILRPSSKLIIEDGGSFILNEGAILEFYDGAEIIMEGANSEFEMRGLVKMMDGGEFKLNHNASTESGRLIIGSSSLGPVGFVKDISNNNPTKVELYGKDKNDAFIVLEENATLFISNDAPTTIDKLTIHDCKVVLEENAKITNYQPFISYQTTYTSDFYNNGVVMTDLNNFSHCDFKDVPVYAYQYVEQNYKFKATNCSFVSTPLINEAHHSLVYVDGVGLDLAKCEFRGTNGACVVSKNLLYPSRISECDISHYNLTVSGNTLVGVNDLSNVEIRLDKNNFHHLYVGINSGAGKLTAKCNTFENIASIDVAAVFGCKLNLSTNDAAGYNYFKGPYALPIYVQNGKIDLQKGRNFFEDIAGNPYIWGTTMNQCAPSSPGGPVSFCGIFADNNQWGTTLAPPLASDFNITGSNGLPMPVLLTFTEAIPTCGFYDDAVIAGGPGNSNFGQAQGNGNGGGNGNNGANGNGVPQSNLPFITTHFNPSIRLDAVVEHALKNMLLAHPTTGNDSEAINTFDDIFKSGLPKNNPFVKKWLDQSLDGMKSSIENGFYEGLLSKSNNVSVFEFYVQYYVDALNFMSDELIEQKNYKEQFYLELDKAHLYRVLGNYPIANEILEEIDFCGLDHDEQIVLNYWKKEYARDLIVEQIGHAYLDTTVVIDTSLYTVPVIFQPQNYFFGATINSVNDIDYKACTLNGTPRTQQQVLGTTVHQIKLHPNPSSEFVVVEFDFDRQAEDLELIINTMDGKEVLRKSIRAAEMNEIRLDVSKWDAGNYMVTTKTTNFGILREKFVILAH